MELSDAEVNALRLRIGRACQAEGPGHHEWLHDTIGRLVSDRDQLARMVKVAAPYVPMGAFENDEAEVRSLRV